MLSGDFLGGGSEGLGRAVPGRDGVGEDGEDGLAVGERAGRPRGPGLVGGLDDGPETELTVSRESEGRTRSEPWPDDRYEEESTCSMTEVRTLDRVVIRFAGDSGDGMQLTGDRFTADSATFGNDTRSFGVANRSKGYPVAENGVCEDDDAPGQPLQQQQRTMSQAGNSDKGMSALPIAGGGLALVAAGAAAMAGGGGGGGTSQPKPKPPVSR